MKTQKNSITTILATISLLSASSIFVNAQSLTNNNEGALQLHALKAESPDINETSAQMLVYDSNLIRPEASSAVLRIPVIHSQSNSHPDVSSLASDVKVEMEEDINIEDWMLNPFVAENNPSEYVEAKVEEHLEVEPWMIDLSLWK